MLGVLSVLVLLVHSVIGASQNGSFINPPQGSDYNQVYYVDQKLHIKWTTSIKNPIYLQIFNKRTSQGEEILSRKQGYTSYGWTVRPVGNSTATDAYYFMITDANDYDNRFLCHEFNITASNASMTAAPSSTAQECNSTSTASSDTCREDGLSSQAKVGIGVGVGLGCAFLIALAVIIWYFHRRTAAAVRQAKLPMAWCKPDDTQYPHQQSRPGIPPVEVQGDLVAHNSIRYELPP